MLIISTIFIPAFGSLMILIAGAYPKIRESISILTAISLFVVVAKLYSTMEIETLQTIQLLEIVPGLSLALSIEPLGILFALVASFLWLVTTIYSIGYMQVKQQKNVTRFYMCFALALAASMGIAFSANIFTLFVFYELLTLLTYPLVTHVGTDDAKRAGRIYLSYLIGSSISLLLLAIAGTWIIAGTLDFTQHGILDGKASDLVICILFALYIFGIGKAALMPFHRWLPAAMVAPTPVSALLHAVAVVKAGVFTVLKVTLYIFGIDLLKATSASEWLIYMATATILIASLIAMQQDNLKARLAYSTISQLAYITLGAMLASSMGIIGSGMHIATHAFAKITLFFCAGIIITMTNKTKVSELHGLGKTMPFTMLAFLIASVSIIGLPPMGGMWSKWYLVMGTLEGQYYLPLLVLLISSLLNIMYLLPIPIRGFFGKSDNPQQAIKEAPLPCLLALSITCAGSVVMFFYPQPMYNLMQKIVS